jgi:maltose alpha-D-glucosyltransferase/alpha-amylase
MTLKDNPFWYKDAIIYQLHVRSFADSDADGVGDFQGLTEKLDYLQDLGVTAIWLLPFYSSPLRDEGYDIADYTGIHSMYGNLQDFEAFLAAAKQRGLRVITELVINHTSDQHPWFQRARRSPPGSSLRDYYVWSDTTERYANTRIIFKDFEFSNWSWDPLAKAYYWHRFYAHQPDLNFDNPDVQQEVLKVASFWLNMGVDGLRLDAIPYLFEREDTNCENLPETHDFLKLFRQHVDENFQDRMLLAEANQWPDDAVTYFGDGDECHMAFHFPLMPRMFVAIRMEDRFPIIDTLYQTPDIPVNAQWALFLRNHDELTLEMVSAEERSFMYRTYARNPRARINLGIRRRLAPLLQNDRNQIELLNGLLFSLPGTPVIYYGDEIGMGDNIYLGDRDGVRTPMQWSHDRNAGFSRANPQRIYSPVVIDPEYHYEAVNVEAQQDNPHSLLRWMKRLIDTRKRYKAFSRGTIEFIYPENRKILAFIRQYEDERVLVIANLSHSIQCAELDLSAYRGRSLVELFDRTVFPPVGELPYFLTLGPHAFYWFALEPQHARHTLSIAPPEERVPTLSVAADWRALFTNSRARMVFEDILPAHLRQRRWFMGTLREIRSASMIEVVPLPYEQPVGYITLVLVEYTEGDSETYALPFTFVSGEQADQIWNELPQVVAVRLHIEQTGEEGIICDALRDRDFAALLFESVVQHRSFRGSPGEVVAFPVRSFRLPLQNEDDTAVDPLAPPPFMTADQHYTTLFYGDSFVLKFFRRIEPGINPDLEIGRLLSAQVSLARVPQVNGALEYHQKNSEPVTLAVLQTFVQNQGDARQQALDELGRYFERVISRQSMAPDLPLPEQTILDLAQGPVSALAQELIDTYLDTARLLGQRTAEMHVALAQYADDPAFAPEPFSDFFQRPFFYSSLGLLERDIHLLQQKLDQLPSALQDNVRTLLEREQDIRAYFLPFRDRKLTGMRIRCHGNYHLGKILRAEDDFVITDFSGDLTRSLDERRMKMSPLRDVASLMRSFHQVVYQAIAVQEKGGINARALRVANWQTRMVWARFWYVWVSALFLRGYLDTVNQSPLLIQTRDECQILLDAYLLERALHELNYELHNRPEQVKVPVQGILQVLESRPRAAGE